MPSQSESRLLDDLDSLKDLIEEECRLNLVKSIIDCACGILKSGVVRRKDSAYFRAWVKEMVMVFTPGEEAKYDMIYDSRLKRISEQFGSE